MVCQFWVLLCCSANWEWDSSLSLAGTAKLLFLQNTSLSQGWWRKAPYLLYMYLFLDKCAAWSHKRFRGKVGQSVRLTRERSPVRIWPKAFWSNFHVLLLLPFPQLPEWSGFLIWNCFLSCCTMIVTAEHLPRATSANLVIHDLIIPSLWSLTLCSACFKVSIDSSIITVLCLLWSTTADLGLRNPGAVHEYHCDSITEKDSIRS